MPSNWHPHTKVLLLLCLVGMLGFMVTAVGLASDYWLIYNLSEDAGTNVTNVLLDLAGLWRVCYQPTALPDDEKPCHYIDYINNMEMSSPVYQYVYPVHGKDLMLAFMVLMMIGIILAFVAEVLAMVCIKKRVKVLFTVTGITFILAGLAGLSGLVVFSLRAVDLLSDWPHQVLGESPYDYITFGWSFAITWLGAAATLLNSTGYLWLARRHIDAMM